MVRVFSVEDGKKMEFRKAQRTITASPCPGTRTAPSQKFSGEMTFYPKCCELPYSPLGVY
jgi:hypothetical protein